MVSDRIECETLIQAPPEVVWDVITDPAHIEQWWGAVAEMDLRPGGVGSLRWREHGAVVPLRVEKVERPHLFSFRWVYPEGVEPHQQNSLLVEFILHAEGEHTRLRVIESGLSEIDWSADRKARYVDDHTRGWAKHIPDLASYATTRVGARAA